MTTLKDIAKDAGVSISTVSSCLSGNKPVKPETKTRIMDSIEKLKYIPNISARNLKSSTSHTIGVVLTDIDNSYHAELFKGISSFLQTKEYDVNVAFSNSSPHIECQLIDNFISLNVAGLLIITCQPQNTDFFHSRILNYNIPTVFIDRQPENLFVNYAGFDNYETAYYLTNAFLSKGYKNIALACGPLHFTSEHEAINGYRDALQKYGLPLRRKLICNSNMSKEDAFRSVLTNMGGQKIEAIIATSENIAAGAMEALSTYGLNISDNISLATFSNECWNSGYRHPGILYTSRTSFQLGCSSANLLLENIKTPHFFESKNIIMHDQILEKSLEVPFAKQSEPRISKTTNNDKKLKVLMADLNTTHSLALLSDSFQKQTGVSLEVDLLPQNKILDQIISTIDNKENIYDIYMYDIPWHRYMIQNSLLADITDYVNSSAFPSSDIRPENLENCSFNNRYYGIPIIGGAQILFYRKDLFEKPEIIKKFKSKYNLSLRPPKTWTEFNGICRFFTQKYNPDSPTKFGTSLAGIVEEELAPEILIRIWSYGGLIYDSYNRPCLNTIENAKAYESILDTINYTNGSPFKTSINDTIQEFSTGKSALLITYAEYAPQINKGILNNIIGRVGYEMLPGKRPARIGWNMGLNPSSTKADLAFQYFSWLSSQNTNFYMTILDGQSPSLAPYHSQELLKLYPWMEITAKSSAYTQKRDGPQKKNTLVIPQNRIEHILCNVLKDILEGGLSISEALSSNQEKMSHLFATYGYPKPYAK